MVRTISVLVQGEFSDDQRSRVEAVAGVSARFVAGQSELESGVANAEVLATSRLSPDALARATELKWVQSWAAGTDALLYPEMVDSPVVLTCCKGNGGIPLAEHALMLMLMLNRGAAEWLQDQRQRRWGRHQHGELNGQVCGIIGLGHSGQDLAEKVKACHMYVIGTRRSPQPTPYVDEVLAPGQLSSLLERSDFVVVTAPLTHETAGMVGEAQLRLMKPSATIICFSRGGIIDEAALNRALREGRIAGAGIDAFAVEPLPASSPLWDAPNTIVTPHNGATTQATRQRGFDIFIDNLNRYASGLSLVNVVDKKSGY
jgi:phosphoglycerate dehydrogenase-like enzyme